MLTDCLYVFLINQGIFGSILQAFTTLATLAVHSVQQVPERLRLLVAGLKEENRKMDSLIRNTPSTIKDIQAIVKGMFSIILLYFYGIKVHV